MMETYSKSKIKVILSALLISTAFSLFSQIQRNESQSSNNSYGVPDLSWQDYLNKTDILLGKVDGQSFINYVIMTSDGNMEDLHYFKTYVSQHSKKDYEELIYKVGTGIIVNEENVKVYLASLQPNYLKYFADFKKDRDNIIKSQSKSGSPKSLPNPNPTPQNCGSPCTNPGFESGSGFWDYWAGDPDTNADPANLTSGFNVAPIPCGGFPPFIPPSAGNPNPHLITNAGAFDPNVPGNLLPVVPPGGGNNALRLGDLVSWGGCSWGAARASISFVVSASNANFTYKYAIVIQDPNDNSHDPVNGFTKRPYFRVKLRDQSGNVLTCGDYEVIADASQPNFTTIFSETSSGSNIWYRPWTTVFVPLSNYIGQCVSIEFTTSDCVPGGHFGYGYVDCYCDPLAIIASSPSICGGHDVNLSAPAGGATYSWSDSLSGGTAGFVGSTTSQNAVVNVAGTYKVVITSVAGPSCLTTLYITVGTNPSSPVAIFSNTTVCHGVPMQFTDASTPLGSITAWKWDFDNDGIPDDSVQNPLHTFPLPGTFPVTLIISWGACNADTTINVFVSPGPLPVLTPAGPFCANAAPINLVADIAGGIWSGNGITNPGLGTFTPSVSVIGNDTVTYTIVGACSAISSEVIIVNPIPIANAGADVNICTGSAASIGAAYVPGYTYSWLPATGLSISTISNPSITTANNGSSPIVTTYTLTAGNSSCSTTDQVVVTINPVPVLIITNPAPACGPATIDLTLPAVTFGSTGGGIFSYYSDAAASIPVPTPSAVGASGTYYIKVTAGGVCSDTGAVTITINPPPISNAGADLTICSGASGNVGTTSATGFTYSWAPVTGITSSSTISNPTISLSNAGPAVTTSSYTVTTTETATGCQSADAADVIVYAVTNVNAGSSQHVCTGSGITLAGSIGGSASSGSWSGGAGTYSPDNMTLNAVYTPSAAEFAADSVVLTLTTNDPAGPCMFSSSNVTFYFYENPSVNFTADLSVGCPIHCTNFTNSTIIGGGDNVQTLTWDFGDGSPTSTVQNPIHCFLQTGFYDITLTAVSNHLCSSTLTQSHMIEVYTVPDAAFSPTPNPVGVLDPTITFNNQSSSDVNYWFWDFGDSITLAPHTSNPVHTYPKIESTTYTVTLIVHNTQGCYDTTYREIFVGPEYTFYIPNSFSPNSDGINDYFFGSGVGIIKFDLLIFDRWGNKIFHGKALNEKWNGRANGGEDIAQMDVFVWKVTLTDIFNKVHDFTGIVTLVK